MDNNNVNKLNAYLAELGDIQKDIENFKILKTLKKKERLLKKAIKQIMLDEDVEIFENADWTVTITKTIKNKVTEAKVLDVIEAFELNQIEDLNFEDFTEPKETKSMKIKQIKKENE